VHLNIVTVVGARPQFVKAAVLSRLIRGPFRDRMTEYLVHTGQHYDEQMSDVFFRQMSIPAPDVNLEVGSGSHGRMTGEMLIRIEEVLMNRRPEVVVVYGDTNSTLAGALAAAKQTIPVAHVEAGLRSFCLTMPEEQNRIITDHLSSFLFCPTATAHANLQREGIREGVEVVGDVMYDASIFYRKEIKRLGRDKSILQGLDCGRDFYLLTLHRAENTDDPRRLASIIGALNECKDCEAVFPIHPRTRGALDRDALTLGSHIHAIEPLGYLDMLELEENCSFVVTDSGGVQKEAYFSGKPCITLREQTEWVETVESGWNILVGSDRKAIAQALRGEKKSGRERLEYGDGEAGRHILESLCRAGGRAA
jgi:UDP-GlcNAc3NAcA epimerase